MALVFSSPTGAYFTDNGVLKLVKKIIEIGFLINEHISFALMSLNLMLKKKY